MKAKKTVFYFPVASHEQALLMRMREPDLADGVPALLEMMGLLADAGFGPAELEQAIQLFRDSQEGEGIDARFDNLEARVKERVEKGLAEIEGRLSKLLAGGATAEVGTASGPEKQKGGSPKPSKPAKSLQGGGVPTVPPEASLAFVVEGELVWAKTAAQFYVAVWRWLFEHGRVSQSDLPIKSGKARHVVAVEPVHPTGKAFFAGKELAPGVWLEAHISRKDICRRSEKFLRLYKVPFDVIVGADA